MRKKNLIVALTLVCCIKGISQGKFSSDMFLTRVTNNAIINGGLVDPSIQGTPYLDSEFKKAVITFTDNNKAEIKARYNIYSDQFEFESGSNYYALLPRTDIKKIELDDIQFVVEKDTESKANKIGYFVVLDSGKIMLLNKLRVKFTDKQQPAAMQYEGTPARYSKVPNVLFYKRDNGVLMKFSGIKKFIADVDDYQEELSLYVKKTNLKNDDEDVVKLIKYYNSL